MYSVSLLNRLNVHTRWVIFITEMFKEGIAVFPSAFKSLIRKRATDMTYKVGIGRHSNSEVHELMVNDLRHFSQLLGKFLTTFKIFMNGAMAELARSLSLNQGFVGSNTT